MFKNILIPIFGISIKTRTERIFETRKISITQKILTIFLVCLNLFLVFSYILGVNNYASTGYEIKALQNKVYEITQINKKLNLEVSEKASSSNLQKELLENNYAFSNSIKYISVDASQIAKK